jgi:hypothetical protein
MAEIMPPEDLLAVLPPEVVEAAGVLRRAVERSRTAQDHLRELTAPARRSAAVSEDAASAGAALLAGERGPERQATKKLEAAINRAQKEVEDWRAALELARERLSVAVAGAGVSAALDQEIAAATTRYLAALDAAEDVRTRLDGLVAVGRWLSDPGRPFVRASRRVSALDAPAAVVFAALRADAAPAREVAEPAGAAS